MNCDTCGRAHRPDARFCGGCGKAFARRCPACGRESEPDAQFCEGCGASLASPTAPPAETRKVVTVVFADLEGSTALHERLDAESVRRFMDRYYQAMRGAVEAEGGTVTQLLGDGVMAVFGAPRVAEDDAIRAVRAAVGMQHAFRALVDAQNGAIGRTGLRIAVNTGEVVASSESEIIGDPVNVAARLQEQARDGDVVIGEATRRLVSELVTLTPLGTFALKGRAETVPAYRVVSLERPAGAPAIAFVGREDELGRLTAVYEAAVTARRARLAVILGSPGLGKSRLLAELARRLGDGATVLSAHCDATGGATFAPIAEALRASLRVEVGATSDAVRAALDAVVADDDAERGRIAAGIAALLAGTPAPPEETFFVVRRLLAALAVATPVLLAIDDLQWAEPLLLDLTEHLVQWSTDAPLLVVVAARPELRDARSSLATPGGLVAEVVTLAGLDAGAATRLAANVIGADELPAAIAGRVLATSEGNPLFLGELVRMLVHDGALKREGDRWTTGVELAALEMPPTIHALLAARIERLGPEERIVLERAAVIGRQFSRAALAHLLPRDLTNVNARLESLRRSELIESDTGWFLGEPVLRFHHVLIRDAAYRRVLKGTRAELHASFAEWLEGRVSDAIEHDETIGWHLEQAHQHLRELGPIDENGRGIGERAARYLAAAGRRALERDDVPLAGSLLGRALARLDTADPARAELALDWCEALLAAGDVGSAARAIDELGRFIAGSERLRAWHTCFAGQRAALTDPQALHATADAVAAAADVLAAAGDAAGEAKAYFVHAIALSRLGRIGACEAALDRALAAARRGNDRRRANAVLAGAPLAVLWGPSPVTRASGRCLDVVRVLRITQGAPAVEAVALRCQAVLEALRGRTEAARRMIASSRHLVEELGITQRLLEADMFAGLIELIEGDAVAAERSLRAAYEGFRANGLGIDAAQAAALLGRALLAQDRPAEAEAFSLESEALAGDDLQAAMAWRGVRAEALARRGEHAAAVELARAAVELAAATDALLYHADARLALAAALRAAGRGDEATVEEARAIELWDAKGATLLAERARGAQTRTVEVDRAPATGAESARPRGGRVRANAATAHAAREDAAFAARGIDAFASLFADDVENVDHRNGATLDRLEYLTSMRRLLKAQELTRRHEPWATLGDALALCHLSVSASGIARGNFDVGAYEVEEVVLFEVDAKGRCRRNEFFAKNRLGDAVARLYERYAELLPDGPARTRAAATARAVAAWNGPLDLDRLATSATPSVEIVDHRILGTWSLRGAEEFLQHWRAQFDVADADARDHEVLALEPDAFLVSRTWSGTDRVGGGAFENENLVLFSFGADGLLTRHELFDADRNAEALACFDELTAEEPPAARPVHRRVRPNAATANQARVSTAISSRDTDALPHLFAEAYEVIEHTTGAVYDYQANLASLRSLSHARDLAYRMEPVATLGDSLALSRIALSASGTSGHRFDVGPYSADHFFLSEVDRDGRQHSCELFAIDRLGEAIVRLYERYAELLPAGPARDRAVATARSVAVLVGGVDLDRWATAFAPSIEWDDLRTVGLGSVHGAEAALRGMRALVELVESPAERFADILALRSDALLVRRMDFGTQRAGGGAYERDLLVLWVFGADGLLARWQQSDPDRDAEALARFDELTAGPAATSLAAAPSPGVEKRRPLRPNAATAQTARLDAALAARDVDALPTLFADEFEVVHHTTGVTYDRQGQLSSYRGLLGAADPRWRQELLATLGDSLALSRVSRSASGFVGRTFDVGAYEVEEIALSEVDAQGRSRRAEVFAADRLGDAVARLYARFAELLPDGPARARAAMTAQVIAAMPGSPERWLFTPDVEAIDHRTVGFGTVRGLERLREAARALLDLIQDSAVRVDDVLALRPDAWLLRWTHSGTDRYGGAFTRHICELLIFGADGLATRWERFDAEQATEALARFDALTAEPPSARIAAAKSRTAKKRERRVRPNAATANAARTDAAIAARDADALLTLPAASSEVVDHIRGVTYDRRGLLATWRSLLSARDPTSHHEPLASVGDALALCRVSNSASGFAGKTFDVGAYEREEIVLIQADAQGQRTGCEVFAPDRLGGAVARLYERYAELLPDGTARARAATTARSVAALLGPYDPERYATAIAPAIEFVDRRTLGLGSAHGAKALLRGTSSLLETTVDTSNRVDDILSLRSSACLSRFTNSGTLRAGGGAYERHFLLLWVFGTDGLVTRWEQFDDDHEDEALARFDELTDEPALARPVQRRVRANAATAMTVRVYAAIAARDPAALAALLAEEYELVSHPTGVTYDRQGELSSFRVFMDSRDPMCRWEPLATLGDSLMLYRLSMSASGFAGRAFDVALDVGAWEHRTVNVVEVDAGGRHRRRMEEFASDRLGDAVVRLYERYAELLPDGPARVRAAATAHSTAIMTAPLEPDRWAGVMAPDIESVDHRTLGTWSAHGAAEMLQHLRALRDLSDDVAARIDDVLALRPEARLVRRTTFGTDRASGGSYERPFIVLDVFGTDGLLTHMEFFDVDRDAEALARFDALTVEPDQLDAARACYERLVPVSGDGFPPKRSSLPIENAATRWTDRFRAAWEARDWEVVAAGFARELRVLDRRKLVRLELDRRGHLESMRLTFEMRSAAFAGPVVATRGARLALRRVRFDGADRDIGPSEIHFLQVLEVDDRGACVAIVMFEPDDFDAAYAELDARYGDSRVYTLLRSLDARDWDKSEALFAPDLVIEDHRRLGHETLHGPAAYIKSFQALVELAPDVRQRLDHLDVSGRAALAGMTLLGTREGGAFEMVGWVVGETDAQGRVRRLYRYDLDQLDEAKACFEAIGASAVHDPLRIPPNAATRGFDRWQEAIAAEDWETAEAINAPTLVFEDRRRGFLVTGDREMLLASDRLIGSSGRISRTVLATAGDRLALQHVSIAGTSALAGLEDVVFEVELLQVLEMDGDGRCVASIWFDADDRRAASAEMLERYAHSAEARWIPPAFFEFSRALAAHDLDRLRTVLPRDFVFDDHRRTGLGRLESAEDYLAAATVLFEQSPDVIIERLYTIAEECHGSLGVTRRFGTSTEGGRFESVFVQLSSYRGDRLVGLELFEPEHLDAARARFAALHEAPSSG